QKLFDQYGVRPTYLVTYPVATTQSSVELLKAFLKDGKCEIGAHCHPWNTPPFEEEINVFNSMLCNLSEALIQRKLSVLHEAISESFSIVPESFRAGRWAFSPAVARVLHRLSYRVDSSVTPFIDWSVHHGPDYSRFPFNSYRFLPDDIATPNDNGALLEVPVSIGFLQGNFDRCHKYATHIERHAWKRLRLAGILNRLGLLNKVLLSPEQTDLKKMIKLAERLRKMHKPYLNMFFHSSNLTAGLTPFVRTRSDETGFLKKIECFLAYCSDNGIESMTLKQLK
ncbi:hypothetical protein ACFL3B_02720, partial [Gemmatimonadota bacterium]